MNDTEKRSLFDIEAERALGLNKSKRGPDKLTRFIGTVLGVGVGFLFSTFILLPIAAYGILSHGYVGMKLWQWFVVPTFDLKPIGFLQCAGVMLLIRLFTYENTQHNKLEGNTKTEKVSYFIGLLLIPWVTLAIGYIIHLLI